MWFATVWAMLSTYDVVMARLLLKKMYSPSWPDEKRSSPSGVERAAEREFRHSTIVNCDFLAARRALTTRAGSMNREL
jgi:hypothetical protein